MSQALTKNLSKASLHSEERFSESLVGDDGDEKKSKEMSIIFDEYHLKWNVIKCKIDWDLVVEDKEVDMDLSVVAFSRDAKNLGVAHFNKPRILNGSVVHWGDSRGRSSNDESERVVFDFEALRTSKKTREAYAFVILVTIYSEGCTFLDVKSGKVRMYDETETLEEWDLGLDVNNDHVAYAVGVIHNKLSPEDFRRYTDDNAVSPKWTLTKQNLSGSGRVYCETSGIVKECLRSIGMNEDCLRGKLFQDKDAVQILKSNDEFVIDSRRGGRIAFALGWDPQCEGCDWGVDVDCSVALFDEEDRHIQDVFYSKPRFPKHGDRIVWHSGDNYTGLGEGDDERIFFDLLQLGPFEVDDTDPLQDYNNRRLKMRKPGEEPTEEMRATEVELVTGMRLGELDDDGKEKSMDDMDEKALSEESQAMPVPKRRVAAAVVAVTIYSGACSLNAIVNGSIRLVEYVDGEEKELFSYELSGDIRTRGVIMGVLRLREDDCWVFRALGIGVDGCQISWIRSECEQVVEDKENCEITHPSACPLCKRVCCCCLLCAIV